MVKALKDRRAKTISFDLPEQQPAINASPQGNNTAHRRRRRSVGRRYQQSSSSTKLLNTIAWLGLVTFLLSSGTLDEGKARSLQVEKGRLGMQQQYANAVSADQSPVVSNNTPEGDKVLESPHANPVSQARTTYTTTTPSKSSEGVKNNIASRHALRRNTRVVPPRRGIRGEAAPDEERILKGGMGGGEGMGGMGGGEGMGGGGGMGSGSGDSGDSEGILDDGEIDLEEAVDIAKFIGYKAYKAYLKYVPTFFTPPPTPSPTIAPPPTIAPSAAPSLSPTFGSSSPSLRPTTSEPPSMSPSIVPSSSPSVSKTPSSIPSIGPSAILSISPSAIPSSIGESVSPSATPSDMPSSTPPSNVPSAAPSTIQESIMPSTIPAANIFVNNEQQPAPTRLPEQEKSFDFGSAHGDKEE